MSRLQSPALREREAAKRRVRGCLLVLAFVPLLLAAQTQQLKVPDAAQFVGQPKGLPLAGDALHLRTAEVAALLRCPVCQGLSVADSPSEMAINMKGQVRELLARGYTEEQILKYFELSYGQFVLLRPKFQGVNAFVWILPILALLGGVALVWAKLRKLDKPPDNAAEPSPAPAPEVDPYVAKVRELVGGGKR